MLYVECAVLSCLTGSSEEMLLTAVLQMQRSNAEILAQLRVMNENIQVCLQSRFILEPLLGQNTQYMHNSLLNMEIVFGKVLHAAPSRAHHC